jgi:hypothetical protein
MSKRKGSSYLADHTILTQSPGAYEKQLEKDAINARKRAKREALRPNAN